MNRILRALLLSFLASSDTISHKVMVQASEEEESTINKPEFTVTVYEGPTSNGGKCPSIEETITEGDYVRIHFTVSIDESSKTGTIGQVFDSTRTSGEPIGATIGFGEVIQAWDLGLIGLCVGDKAVLVAPPHLAYGDNGTGDGEDDIPGGATIKFDIEVVSVMEGPPDEEDEEDAKAMFNGADTNKDGLLSRAEFDEMFASQIGEVDDAEEMNAIQQQLDAFWQSQDANDDGFLSLEEFLAPSDFDDYGEGEEGFGAPEDEFKEVDSDGDGKISKEEVTAFFASVEEEVPADFWEHMDANKDGFITFDEFYTEGEDKEDGEYEDEF